MVNSLKNYDTLTKLYDFANKDFQPKVNFCVNVHQG